MLFYIGWKARAGQGPKEPEAALEIFSRWEPPTGMEIKGMWARADGGGCDLTSDCCSRGRHQARALRLRSPSWTRSRIARR